MHFQEVNNHYAPNFHTIKVYLNRIMREVDCVAHVQDYYNYVWRENLKRRPETRTEFFRYETKVKPENEQTPLHDLVRLTRVEPFVFLGHKNAYENF